MAPRRSAVVTCCSRDGDPPGGNGKRSEQFTAVGAVHFGRSFWSKETLDKVAPPNAKGDDEPMEQSIRNEIPGTVKEIISDKVLSEIIVETGIGEMAAVITTRSVRDMGLKVGDHVAALIKATNVSVRRQS